MTLQELRLWFCASMTDNAVKRRLITRFGGPAEVYTADVTKLCDVGELSEIEAERLAGTRTEKYTEQLIRSLDRAESRFMWHEETKFPMAFREIDDPPFGIFYSGELPRDSECFLSVVGTRLCSPYGTDVATEFCRILAEAGVVIVSGMALGIDGCAHRGALDGRGRTVAVLGSGIGRAYPADHKDLYAQIVQNGCVISEYAPGVPGLKHHFPHRNRLIAALGDALLVVEAKLKSGTMITVDRALEQGKEVFAIPGRITDRNSDGCHRLIKQGAQLVTDPAEILAIMREKPAFSQVAGTLEDSDGQLYLPILSEYTEKNTKLPLASNEKMVYASLRLSPKSFDQLVWECGLTPASLSRALYALSQSERIRQTRDGLYFARESRFR